MNELMTYFFFVFGVAEGMCSLKSLISNILHVVAKVCCSPRYKKKKKVSVTCKLQIVAQGV